jgi:hypothetical protein
LPAEAVLLAQQAMKMLSSRRPYPGCQPEFEMR